MEFISEIRTLGSNSLISLLRQFKLYDDNNTKELELYEFTKVLLEFETELSEKEILSIFNYFDKEKTCFINYVNFINETIGLDIGKSGQVEIDEIKLQFTAKNDGDVNQAKKLKKMYILNSLRLSK